MDSRSHVVAAARGDRPFDLAIRNVKLINVLSGEVYPADIGISGDRVSYVGAAGANPIDSTQQIDGTGLWASPGFIDGHVHNESSMCTPARWAEVIVPRGTTTVCTDPHEIGNVLGMKGVRYMLSASEGLPLRYFVTVPSCVPAVPELETAGATFTEKEVSEMLGWDRVVAIAEAMDFVSLANQTGKITRIVEAGHRAQVPIEGHAPGVTGRFLQAYLAAAGPRSTDHESLTTENIIEKIRLGAMIYARVSSFVNPIQEQVDAIRALPETRMFGLCTDDLVPEHLLELGHMDFGMRSLIAAGVEPIKIYQMATINVAQHYGLWGLGAIAPGWFADIVLLDNLEQVHACQVISSGKLVAQNGQLLTPLSEPVPPLVQNSVHLPEDLDTASFLPRVKARQRAKINAINLANLIDTDLEQVEVSCVDGRVSLPLPEGVAIAAVVGRHGQNRPPSLALVTGYPIQSGAIASTISHDSHNLVLIGKTPLDMVRAARGLAECGGGLISVKDDEILERVPLPIAGIMSPLPTQTVAQQVARFNHSLSQLGLPESFPLILLALALPVIPNIRLTDLGIVDINTQKLIPLEA